MGGITTYVHSTIAPTSVHSAVLIAFPCSCHGAPVMHLDSSILSGNGQTEQNKSTEVEVYWNRLCKPSAIQHLFLSKYPQRVIHDFTMITYMF